MPRKTHTACPPELLLENQACFALYSASLAMTKLYKPQLEALGLTYPQYLVMLVLWEQDDQTVSDVGERLFLDSGTLTPLLKRLEASGLIARERDPQDERRVRVSLTADGRTLRRQAQAVPHCILQSSQCSLSELVALTQQLKDLRSKLLQHSGT